MPGYAMTIDGQPVKGSKSTGAINPARSLLGFTEIQAANSVKL